MGRDRRRRLPWAAGDATDPAGGLDGFDHRVRAVEWKEVATRVDDLDRRGAELTLEDLSPAWFEKRVVRAPEDQGRHLELFDVLRPADQVTVVERPRGSQIGAAPAEILERSRPLVDDLVGDAARRDHPFFESLSQPL